MVHGEHALFWVGARWVHLGLLGGVVFMLYGRLLGVGAVLVVHLDVLDDGGVLFAFGTRSAGRCWRFRLLNENLRPTLLIYYRLRNGPLRAAALAASAFAAHFAFRAFVRLKPWRQRGAVVGHLRLGSCSRTAFGVAT